MFILASFDSNSFAPYCLFQLFIKMCQENFVFPRVINDLGCFSSFADVQISSASLSSSLLLQMLTASEEQLTLGGNLTDRGWWDGRRLCGGTRGGVTPDVRCDVFCWRLELVMCVMVQQGALGEDEGLSKVSTAGCCHHLHLLLCS